MVHHAPRRVAKGLAEQEQRWSALCTLAGYGKSAESLMKALRKGLDHGGDITIVGDVDGDYEFVPTEGDQQREPGAQRSVTFLERPEAPPTPRAGGRQRDPTSLRFVLTFYLPIVGGVVAMMRMDALPTPLAAILAIAIAASLSVCGALLDNAIASRRR